MSIRAQSSYKELQSPLLACASVWTAGMPSPVNMQTHVQAAALWET